MSLILLSSVGIFVFLGIAFLVLFRKLSSGNRETAFSGDLESLFAPSRYKPMERLLDPADGSFLALEPGCSRSMMQADPALQSWSASRPTIRSRSTSAISANCLPSSIRRSPLAPTKCRDSNSWCRSNRSCSTKPVMRQSPMRGARPTSMPRPPAPNLAPWCRSTKKALRRNSARCRPCAAAPASRSHRANRRYTPW